MDMNSLIAMWLLLDDEKPKSYVKGKYVYWNYHEFVTPNENFDLKSRSSYFLIEEVSSDLKGKITSGEWYAGTTWNNDQWISKTGRCSDFIKMLEENNVTLIAEDFKGQVKPRETAGTVFLKELLSDEKPKSYIKGKYAYWTGVFIPPTEKHSKSDSDYYFLIEEVSPDLREKVTKEWNDRYTTTASGNNQLWISKRYKILDFMQILQENNITLIAENLDMNLSQSEVRPTIFVAY